MTVVCSSLYDLVEISLHAHVEKSLSSVVITRAVEQGNALAAVCSSSFIWHWDNRQHLLAVWILNCVSIWMVWSSFQNAVSKGAICYPHPTSCILTHTCMLTHPSHCCYNGFTHRWPCSNEVWSFCDATGKLSCGTVLFILVHLLPCYTALIYLLILAHSVASIGKMKPNIHHKMLTFVQPFVLLLALATVVWRRTNSHFGKKERKRSSWCCIDHRYCLLFHNSSVWSVTVSSWFICARLCQCSH